jgi:cytochrome c oxidase cbb3-type subunit 1
MHPIYLIRAIGGVFFLAGAVLMAYNFYKTIRCGEEVRSIA